MSDGLHPWQKKLIHIPEGETLNDALEQIAKDALKLKDNFAESAEGLISKEDVAAVYKMQFRIDRIRTVIVEAAGPKV